MQTWNENKTAEFLDPDTGTRPTNHGGWERNDCYSSQEQPKKSLHTKWYKYVCRYTHMVKISELGVNGLRCLDIRLYSCSNKR